MSRLNAVSLDAIRRIVNRMRSIDYSTQCKFPNRSRWLIPFNLLHTHYHMKEKYNYYIE